MLLITISRCLHSALKCGKNCDFILRETEPILNDIIATNFFEWREPLITSKSTKSIRS